MGISTTSPTSPPNTGSTFIELFNPFAVIQGTWTLVAAGATNLRGGYITNTTSHADGDEINFKSYLSAGTYQACLLFTKAANTGILKVYIGSTLVLTQDLYDAGTVYNVAVRGTATAISSSGMFTVRVVIDGKNGASSDHKCNLQSLSIARTA